MNSLGAELFRQSSLFREAINATQFTKDHWNMQRFPSECCHHASLLLGLYLFDCGFGPSSIISGDHPTDVRAQHHWLSVRGFVVDITADQFGRPDVIVAIDSEWHAQLNGSAIREETFDDAYWESVRQRGYHGPLYKLIRANIPDGPSPRTP